MMPRHEKVSPERSQMEMIREGQPSSKSMKNSLATSVRRAADKETTVTSMPR